MSSQKKMYKQKPAKPRALEDEGGIWLTLRSVDAKRPDLDIFTASEAIEELVGDVELQPKKKTGEYLIKVRTEEQANRLTRMKRINKEQKVKIERNVKMNSCRCVISHPTITGITDETLLKKFSGQGVTDVRSIKPMNRLKILTLNGTVVPKQIKVGLLYVKTSPYYPMVKFCRNCWEVGHITLDCNNAERCSNCSGNHVAVGCEKPPFCANCGGEHKPAAKSCPLVLQERAITKIQVDQVLAPHKARKVYRKKNKGYIHLPEELPNHGMFNVGDDESDSEMAELEQERDDAATTLELVEPETMKLAEPEATKPAVPETTKPAKPATPTSSKTRKRKSAEKKTTDRKGPKPKAKKMVISDDEDDFLNVVDELATRD